MCSVLFQAVKQHYSFSSMEETRPPREGVQVYLKRKSHTRWDHGQILCPFTVQMALKAVKQPREFQSED